MPRDKAKKRARHAAYYASNKDKILLKQSMYYEENKETKLAKQALYRLNNPEKIQATEAARYLRRRETLLLQQPIYRRAHPEVSRKATKRYRLAHPEKQRGNEAKRRARKHNAPINDFTEAQWQVMQAAYDHRCVYCKKRFRGKLTREHLTPLSKGGSHTIANILPACRSCNSRKQAGPVLKPVQPLLL